MIRKILLFSFCLSLVLKSYSQISIKDSSINTGMFSANYSYDIPLGDLKDRFGDNSTIGGKFSYKTTKNWIFEFQGDFIFGNSIKEDNIFDSIKTPKTSAGYIIDGNGRYAEVHLYERGYKFSLNGGKILPIIGPNKNCGIALIQGFGFIQHKIRIENPDNITPQIKGDYKKGYDRLTNGFAMTQFIGYVHLGNNRLFSFYAGIEFTEAWTRNRRSYNFDTQMQDDKLRFDGMCGAKVGWIIPMYKKVPKQFYYN